MKYFNYETEFDFDKEKNQKYILSAYKNLYKVGCDDENLAEFFKDFGYDKAFDTGLPQKLPGSDGFLYDIYPDFTTVRVDKYDNKLIKRVLQIRRKRARLIGCDEKYKLRVLTASDRDSICIKRSASGYDRGVYTNPDSGCAFPFRLKRAKTEGSPVLIYFHGAGASGHDNVKNLFEYVQASRHFKAPDCNIIIPQAPHLPNGNSAAAEHYISGCKLMIEKVVQECGGDIDRIYTVGVSFGACCVWQLITDYSELLAAAIPAMGFAPNISDIDFDKLTRLPIWIVHASDDRIVPIVGDDFCYDRLKGKNPNVKYSRYDKYGHKTAIEFFKSEPWQEWLFSHTRASHALQK